MASGGRVRPKQGKSYPNRTDLRAGPNQSPTQPAQAAPNQTYGEAGSQLAAQHQLPLSNASAPVASPQAAPGPSQPAAPGGPGGGGPVPVPSLTAPTARPNEPITAGLPTGAGPGPEALGHQSDPTLAMLRGAYAALPTPGLLSLIQEAMHSSKAAPPQ